MNACETVRELRERAARFLKLADEIEECLPEVKTASSEEKPRQARQVSSSSAMPIREAIAQALASGPLTPAALKKAVLLIRPDTPPHQIHKQCHVEKTAQRICKGDDGRWRLYNATFESSEPPAALDTPAKNPAGPSVALPTVADLVRQAAREPQHRTTIGIIDRVEQIAPFRVRRDTVSTTISQYLKSGVLIRKGQDEAGAPYIRPAEESSLVVNA